MLTEEQAKDLQLVARIQAGEQELIPELWARVSGFVEWKASKRLRQYQGRRNIEKDELISAGFFALVKAVSSFSLNGGGGFLPWFDLYLKKEFANVFGLRARREDLLDKCERSLDDPLQNAEGEDLSLHDVVPDPRSMDGYTAVEDEDYTTQLHAALEAALADLPPEEAEAIRISFFEEKTIEEGAAQLGVDGIEFRKLKDKGLRSIRRGSHVLELASFNPYAGTGFQSWLQSSCSVQERYVIQVDSAEQRAKRLEEQKERVAEIKRQQQNRHRIRAWHNHEEPRRSEANGKDNEGRGEGNPEETASS